MYTAIYCVFPNKLSYLILPLPLLQVLPNCQPQPHRPRLYSPVFCSILSLLSLWYSGTPFLRSGQPLNRFGRWGDMVMI